MDDTLWGVRRFSSCSRHRCKRSKIGSDQNHIKIDISLYPLFSRKLPFKSDKLLLISVHFLKVKQEQTTFWNSQDNTYST